MDKLALILSAISIMSWVFDSMNDVSLKVK